MLVLVLGIVMVMVVLLLRGVLLLCILLWRHREAWLLLLLLGLILIVRSKVWQGNAILLFLLGPHVLQWRGKLVTIDAALVKLQVARQQPNILKGRQRQLLAPEILGVQLRRG